MNEVLKDLITELDKIKMDEWVNTLIPFEERSGNIYHYTHAQGALGILQSGKLWATHFLGMNDVSEVRYAQQVAIEAIERHSHECSKLTRDLLGGVNIIISTVEEVAAPYLVSFCDRDNLLSQWREYGARGDGFAIGFDKPSLTTAFGRRVYLLKVTYDRGLQDQILKDTLRRFCNAFEEYIAEHPQHAREASPEVEGVCG
jgi:hypothetical protein